jgi:putative ABC transport system permease protein
VGVIWHKVWYDIWRSPVRTLLAVLSIAAGVFAVGVIFGLTDQVYSGMDAAHQAVVPSHINMSLDTPIDRDTAQALVKVAGVENVEPYNELAIRYKIQPQDKWQPGMLVMRDDYAHQTYDMVQLKEGAWPTNDTIGIERLTSQWHHLSIGSSVIFEVGNTQRSLPITGLIRHPFVPPPRFGGQGFFFVDADGMERFGIAKGQFWRIYVRVTPYSQDHAREVASAIKERLGREGVGVLVTLYQEPTRHWARPFVEGVTVVMQALAVISLLLSVVLVLNTLVALITQQTNQIGIIKAIGGTTRTVIKIYLAGVMIYGILALLISLPLGVMMSFLLSRWFLNLFNVDYPAFRWSNPAVALQILAALAVPLVAALWPVLHGAVITVREAMSTYGLGADFGNDRLDQWVERVGSRLLPAVYAMVLANTIRRKGRLVLSILVLIAAGCMFLMVMSLATSIKATVDDEFLRRHYDISLQFKERERIDQATALAAATGGVAASAVWYIQPARILLQGQRAREAGVGTQIQGVPINDPMYRPLIVAGRWLESGDSHAILMNEETANDNHLKLGDTVSLDLGSVGRSDWQIVGLYRVVFATYQLQPDVLYAPLEAVLTTVKKSSQGGLLYVRTLSHGAETVREMANELEDIFRAHNMQVRYGETIDALRAAAYSEFQVLISMFLALAVLAAGVGGVGLAGALGINVIERRKEIGVLRAIGACSGTITNMFVLEGVLQGLLSWIVAVPLSFVAGRPLANALGRAMFNTDLNYCYNASAVAIWLAAILVISVLAALLPARNAARISVQQSLAYE